MKNHADRLFWPGLGAGAFLIVALSVSLSLPAAAQTITLTPGLVYAGCQVVGTGGNNINNLNFLPPPQYVSGPAGDGSTKLTIIEWTGAGFNQYMYFNCADSGGEEAGWYSPARATSPANVNWNPGEGMVLHNASASTTYTITLTGTTPATPVVPPFNYGGCGGWSFLCSQTPNTSSTYQQVTGFAPVDGSEIAYSYALGPVVSYTYQSGAWTPAGSPTVVNDQAAFFFVPCPTASGTFTGPSVTGPPVPGVTPSTTSVGVWNIYASETGSPSYGVDPDSLFGGDFVSPSSVINLPAGGSGPVSWSDNFPSSSTASVAASFASDPSGNGLIITLNNPNSTPDEVRFDWVNNYQHSGAPNTINNYSITCSGTTSGSGYWEVASGETLLVYDASGNTLGTATASTASAAGVAHLYGPAGAGPWLGSMASTFNQTYTLPFSPAPTVSGSDFVLANGYVDVIVDPGTFQIQIGMPPNLGIGLYSNSPVVFYPSSAGNWQVQMTTNLLTGPWLTVTNGVPFTGMQIPNVAGPAFFRVQ